MKRKQTVQRSLDLEVPIESQIALPSPKRTRKDVIADGEMPWGLAYAAFSRSFATAAVSELIGKKRLTIVDPFVGSGTTVEASMENGCSCIGVDLNPYSALTSRVRGANGQTFAGVERVFDSLLDKAKIDTKAASKKSNFDPLNSLIRTLGDRLKVDSAQVVPVLCSRKGGEFDNELIALCSITYAARLTSNLSRGSNPTWTKSLNRPAGRGNSDDLLDLASQVSKHMIEKLSEQARHRATYTRIFNSDFSAAAIAKGSIKRFLTSPPYLNRLDYVQSNLPEIQRLTTAEASQLNTLRAQMMGTTKMRGIDQEAKDYSLSSLSANAVLDQIRSHPSKASATYYLKFFLQYFLDVERFFRWLSAKTSSDAVGMIVLQDSYYKDFVIPLTDIYREFGEVYGFRSDVVANWKKLNHIGNMSPVQRKHAPSKVLTESVLLFKKESH